MRPVGAAEPVAQVGARAVEVKPITPIIAPPCSIANGWLPGPLRIVIQAAAPSTVQGSGMWPVRWMAS